MARRSGERPDWCWDPECAFCPLSTRKQPLLEAAGRPDHVRCLPRSAQAAGSGRAVLRYEVSAVPSAARSGKGNESAGEGLPCSKTKLRALPHAEVSTTESAFDVHRSLDTRR